MEIKLFNRNLIMVKEFNNQEYNKMCAVFLGYQILYKKFQYQNFCSSNESYFEEGEGEIVCDEVGSEVNLYPDGDPLYELEELPFDSDWNWIMQVKIGIENIRLEIPKYNVLEWFNVHIYSSGCLIESGLKPSDGETKSPYYYSNSVWKSDDKQAVVQAIWEFLNWYKENKKL